MTGHVAGNLAPCFTVLELSTPRETPAAALALGLALFLGGCADSVWTGAGHRNPKPAPQQRQS